MQTASDFPIKRSPEIKYPYAINPDQANVLAQAISEGNFPTVACRIAGVSISTFNDWMLRGGDPNSNDKGKPAPGTEVEPYKSFCAMILAAEGESETRALKSVRRAGSNDWRAEAWFLSRRHNDRWGEKNTGVQVSTTGTVQFFLPENNRDTPSDESAPRDTPTD